jgi:hypothetical protein
MTSRVKLVLFAVAVGVLLWWSPIYGLPRWLGWPLFAGAVYLAGALLDAFVKAIRRQRPAGRRSPL